MSQLAIKVLQAIQTAIDKDKLVLPTMPEIAMRVREVAQDDNSTIQTMADVIGTDAAITARIIKVGNSPIFRGAQEITDLNNALFRLGMQYACNLAMGLAMEQMFHAKSPVVDKKLREVWERSGEIAGACSVICKHYTKLSPDQAALAGLIHKIGVLPILAFAEEHPVLLKDANALSEVINKVHPAIGVQILSSWDFPEELQKIPEQYINFSRKAEKADYADIVTVAMLEVCGDDSEFDNLDAKDVTAFERLGIDPMVGFGEVEDLTEQMNAAMGMLT